MADKLKQRIKQDHFESPTVEALLNLLVTADFLRGRSQGLCEEFDITLPQYNVLRILRGVYPGGHPRCEIAGRMIERAPDVTRLVDRLVEQKLVERVASEEDARHSMARITKKGLKLLEAMQARVDAFDRQLSEKLSPTEARQLSELCEKLYSE